MLKGEIYIIIGVVLGIIGLIGTSILVRYGWDLRKYEITTMKGEIDVPDVDLNQPFILYLGGGKITIENITPQYEFNLRQIFDMGQDLPFSIKFRENKLLVSMEIKNKEGESIVKIVDNQWMVNTNPIIAYDRNYNDYAFEVIDSDLIPTLQVLLIGDNEIFFGGVFNIPIGKLLAYPPSIIINPSQEMIEKHKENRIFEYPSEENFGRLLISMPDFVSELRALFETP